MNAWLNKRTNRPTEGFSHGAVRHDWTPGPPRCGGGGFGLWKGGAAAGAASQSVTLILRARSLADGTLTTCSFLLGVAYEAR